MKVRMRQEVSGNDRKYEIGEVCDLPDDHANRWIDAGIAEPVPPEPVAEPPEPVAELEPVAVAAGVVPEAATLEDASERATLPPARKREQHDRR